MKKIIYLSFIISSALLSCKKEDISKPNSGIYRGVFRQIYDNGDTVAKGISVISISSSEMNYSAAGDTATSAPMHCSGSYELNGETEITFKNNSVLPQNYNPYHILDTTWMYYFNDVKFNIWLRMDTVLYEYRLERK